VPGRDGAGSSGLALRGGDGADVEQLAIIREAKVAERRSGDANEDERARLSADIRVVYPGPARLAIR
jgi:hypothetical protein